MLIVNCIFRSIRCIVFGVLYSIMAAVTKFFSFIHHNCRWRWLFNRFNRTFFLLSSSSFHFRNSPSPLPPSRRSHLIWGVDLCSHDPARDFSRDLPRSSTLAPAKASQQSLLTRKKKRRRAVSNLRPLASLRNSKSYWRINPLLHDAPTWNISNCWSKQLKPARPKPI